MKIVAIWRCSGHIYIDHPAKFQLSGVKKSPTLTNEPNAFIHKKSKKIQYACNHKQWNRTSDSWFMGFTCLRKQAVLCHLKKIAGPLWPNLIFYTIFLLFFEEHDFLITLPHPQFTTMHCNAFKCTKNALFCVFNRAILVHFECISVYCSELIRAWGWGSVMKTSSSPQNNIKKVA